MLCANLGQVDINLKWLDDAIRKNVPAGRESFNETRVKFDKIKDLYCYRDLKDTKLFNRQIGTLGGGNHFIELDKDDDGNHYLVIHTGSRNLGNQVASYYQSLAVKLCSGFEEWDKKQQELIKTYKEQGRRTEIQEAIKELHRQMQLTKPSVPSELCYLTGEYKDKYLHDMEICQEYAMLNRIIICGTILNEIFGKQSFTLVNELEMAIEKAKQYNVSKTIPYFQTIHNYLDFEDNIIRKGSIRANNGEKVIIPMNMRDGSLICIGKGNEDYNNSAPHGAGRLMSRSKAKENINIEDFKNSMKDIYTTSVNESTIDEAPQVYKPMQEIIDNISDTVDIINIIKPVYNFKASN